MKFIKRLLRGVLAGNFVDRLLLAWGLFILMVIGVFFYHACGGVA